MLIHDIHEYAIRLILDQKELVYGYNHYILRNLYHCKMQQIV